METVKIIERLKTFGYEYIEKEDAYSLDFAMSKVTWNILNNINQSEIPEGLMFIAIDMVCAEFLKIKKGFGELDSIDFELIANNIKLGDTNIQFAPAATPEQKFDASIDYLLTGYESEFIRYRKLVW